MTKNVKTAINTIVFLALGCLLFYLAIGRQDTDTIWQNIKSANPIWIGASLLCGILSHLARSLRWNTLIKPLGYSASVWGSFHAVILGYLVNMALPRVGEITRPAALSKVENIPFNKLVGTVVAERVVDLIITLLLAVTIFFLQFGLIAGFFSDKFAPMQSSAIAIYATLGSLSLLAIYILYLKRFWFYELPIFNKFKGFLEGLLDGVKSIFKLEQKGLFIFYSLFIWVMYFFMPFFIFYALEGTAHLGVSAGLTVLLFGTAAMIVPIPGGIGTFELMVPAALVLYGIDDDTLSDSYAVITHAIQFIVIIGVGIFSILYFMIKTKQIKKNELERTD